MNETRAVGSSQILNEAQVSSHIEMKDEEIQMSQNLQKSRIKNSRVARTCHEVWKALKV